MSATRDCEVLVVGAGPTGLTLAASLRAYGIEVRIVDQCPDRVHESRALGVQPRSLEVLRGLGVADELVRRGNSAARLQAHAGTRVTSVPMFDLGLDDTAYSFLLFLSQAEIESVLGEHLAAQDVRVERGVRLVSHASDGSTCTLARPDGSPEVVRARYVAGCDGVHSTVREQAGIRFTGARYPQTFLLADLEVDGLDPGSVHTFVTDRGPLLFFPLRHPASWRLIGMRPAHPTATTESTGSGQVTLAELQSLTDEAAGPRLRLHDPVWMTAFHLAHRQAETYRSGRAFLAGDAAHVHSPVGAQGMNTGIQDAWNLAWKLALVCRGVAPESLLASYDEERRPVGQFVVRFTDRAFTVVASTHPALRLLRAHVVPRVMPAAVRLRPARAAAFRTVSQLDVRYRQSSALPARRRGRRPGTGDRLPDVPVVRDGERVWLHEALSALGFHLLLVGAVPDPPRRFLQHRYGDLLTVTRLDRRPAAGTLVDPGGVAAARLRVRRGAVLLIRPDGHIATRSDRGDHAAAQRYLAGWLTGAPRATAD